MNTFVDSNRARFQPAFTLGFYFSTRFALKMCIPHFKGRTHDEIEYQGLVKCGFVLVDMTFLFL